MFLNILKSLRCSSFLLSLRAAQLKVCRFKSMLSSLRVPKESSISSAFLHLAASDVHLRTLAQGRRASFEQDSLDDVKTLDDHSRWWQYNKPP